MTFEQLPQFLLSTRVPAARRLLKPTCCFFVILWNSILKRICSPNMVLTFRVTKCSRLVEPEKSLLIASPNAFAVRVKQTEFAKCLCEALIRCLLQPSESLLGVFWRPRRLAISITESERVLGLGFSILGPSLECYNLFVYF